MTEGRGTHIDSRARDSQTQKGETLTETEGREWRGTHRDRGARVARHSQRQRCETLTETEGRDTHRDRGARHSQRPRDEALTGTEVRHSQKGMALTEGRDSHRDTAIKPRQTDMLEGRPAVRQTDKSDTSMTVCFTESRTGLARGEALIHVKCKALRERHRAGG